MFGHLVIGNSEDPFTTLSADSLKWSESHGLQKYDQDLLLEITYLSVAESQVEEAIKGSPPLLPQTDT